MDDEQKRERGFAWLPPETSFEMCTPWVRYQIGISARGPIGERGGREKRNATRPLDVRAIVLRENSAVKKKGRKYVNPYRPVAMSCSLLTKIRSVNGLELTQFAYRLLKSRTRRLVPKQQRKHYLIDSLSLVLRHRPRFYAVFGGYLTQI